MSTRVLRFTSASAHITRVGGMPLSISRAAQTARRSASHRVAHVARRPPARVAEAVGLRYPCTEPRSLYRHRTPAETRRTVDREDRKAITAACASERGVRPRRIRPRGSWALDLAAEAEGRRPGSPRLHHRLVARAVSLQPSNLEGSVQHHPRRATTLPWKARPVERDAYTRKGLGSSSTIRCAAMVVLLAGNVEAASAGGQCRTRPPPDRAVGIAQPRSRCPRRRTVDRENRPSPRVRVERGVRPTPGDRLGSRPTEVGTCATQHSPPCGAALPRQAPRAQHHPRVTTLPRRGRLRVTRRTSARYRRRSDLGHGSFSLP